jgi:hypothetical protein
MVPVLFSQPEFPLPWPSPTSGEGIQIPSPFDGRGLGEGASWSLVLTSSTVTLYTSFYSENEVCSQNKNRFRYCDYEKEVKWIISIF